MKINNIGLNTKVSSKNNLVPKNETGSFDKIKNQIKNLFIDSSSPLNSIESQLKNVGNLSGKELLGLQIRASNYHVKVELTTKVAESLISTSRRLQQVQ